MIIRGDATRIPLPDCSVDAVVTDPPYGLEFMGKEWDKLNLCSNAPTFHAGYEAQVFHELWARECLRVLKPGGHLLAFGGTRTYHRMTCAIEDAGLEVRDCLAWLYGSGFPKSLDVSKALDKMAGAEREVLGEKIYPNGTGFRGSPGSAYARGKQVAAGYRPTGEEYPQEGSPFLETAPATPEAEKWQGWGTALKPAHEPIVLARKPLTGTVASNVLRWGTGALNVDGCRVSDGGQLKWSQPRGGRWPPNVTMDEEAARLLDEQSGEFGNHARRDGRIRRGGGSYWDKGHVEAEATAPKDFGGASRFMYVAKASRAERNAGLEGLTCSHPTVKPLALMRWLVRLVTPPGGIVLDPFLGSGTTLLACAHEGMQGIGIEREAEYVEIARGRLSQPIQAGML